jgi:hypothetical protein
MKNFIYVRCYVDISHDMPPSFMHKFVQAEDEADAYFQGLCRSPELTVQEEKNGYHGRAMNDYVIEVFKSQFI